MQIIADPAQYAQDLLTLHDGDAKAAAEYFSSHIGPDGRVDGLPGTRQWAKDVLKELEEEAPPPATQGFRLGSAVMADEDIKQRVLQYLKSKGDDGTDLCLEGLSLEERDEHRQTTAVGELTQERLQCLAYFNGFLSPSGVLEALLNGERIYTSAKSYVLVGEEKAVMVPLPSQQPQARDGRILAGAGEKWLVDALERPASSAVASALVAKASPKEAEVTFEDVAGIVVSVYGAVSGSVREFDLTVDRVERLASLSGRSQQQVLRDLIDGETIRGTVTETRIVRTEPVADVRILRTSIKPGAAPAKVLHVGPGFAYAIAKGSMQRLTPKAVLERLTAGREVQTYQYRYRPIQGERPCA